MSEDRNTCFDRRSAANRRRVYDLDYFLNGGGERRSREERRSVFERRSGWFRVSKWVSVSGREIGISAQLNPFEISVIMSRVIRPCFFMVILGSLAATSIHIFLWFDTSLVGRAFCPGWRQYGRIYLEEYKYRVRPLFDGKESVKGSFCLRPCGR